MFQSRELREPLNAASVPLKSMILQGINCGFGSADVGTGTLPIAAVDLKRGWHGYHGPKTGTQRQCPLWPETIAELRGSLKQRPCPSDDEYAHLFFLPQRGLPWHRGSSDNPLSKEAAKLLKTLAIKRRRLNFYALRHTFETIAGELGDQIAVSYIMGHAEHPNDMPAVYREQIGDARLVAVTDHVRAWLFPDKIVTG